MAIVRNSAQKGTAGLNTQSKGPATVSGVAAKSGGLGAGNLIDVDLDEELFKICSDDTPLMQVMLKAKKVKVNSPVVEHYMIDEPVPSVFTSSAMKGGSDNSPLPLSPGDKQAITPFTTLLAKGLTAYAADGKTELPGTDMMLMVKDRNAEGNPIVIAVNGAKTNPTDTYCILPDIPKGTQMIILSTALYETQKEVEPDLIIPQATDVYLQKRGMNQIISDYFESQKKRIPFGKAVQAEAALRNFKVRSNRTFWAGQRGLITVDTKLGPQSIYFTEGLRWQIKREMSAIGEWTVERLIGMTKIIFTGEDVPKSVTLFVGKQLLERLQTIDYSKHPEIQLTKEQNETVGWAVTRIHTVFGDIDLKHEPTFDRLGWGGSGAAIDTSRLVHYVYSQEHSTNDKVDGHEATRSAIIVWDALALKGTCHVWLNGDEEPRPNTILFWDDPETAPTAEIGSLFYLTVDCEAISPAARQGEIWIRKTSGWDLASGIISYDWGLPAEAAAGTKSTTGN